MSRKLIQALETIAGSGRSWRAVRAAGVSLLSKGVSIAGTLITIPLVLNQFGPEQYGLWTTLSVIFIYLRLADGGVTIGLIALVSQSDGSGDKKNIQALFSSAFLVTVIVAGVLLLTAAASLAVDWRWVLNLNDESLQHEARACTAVIIVALAIGYPAAVARQGRLGLQHGAAANGWDLAASLVGFGGQLFVVYADWGLIALAAVTAFAPTIINIVSSVVFFFGKGRAFQPRFELVNRRALVALFSTGLMFMGLTLAQALSIQFDTVLVARMVDLPSVTEYSVVQKLFLQPQVIVSLGLIALFPGLGEALARGEHDWIRRNFQRMLFAGTSFALLSCALMALLAKPLLRLWIGETIDPSQSLIWIMAIYGVVSVVGNIFTYFFFALGLYWRVLLAFTAMIGINIPIAVLLIPHFGAAGAGIAGIVGYCAALIVPSLFGINAILKNLSVLQGKMLEKKNPPDLGSSPSL